MNAKKIRGIASWIWWVLVLAVIALVIIGISSDKETAKDKDSISKVKVEAKTMEVITLKPGEFRILKVNSESWSPWIDASYDKMHANIRIKGDRIYQFPSGKRDTVREGNSIKLPGDIYRIKTVEGENTAVIRTAMHPINKKLFK